MSPAVFLDATVPVYAAGTEHPYRGPCARILRMVGESPRSFVTDAGVLKELLHRYLASRRWALGREVVRAFARAMHGRVEPVHAADVALAADLADIDPQVSARDLVHAAVMRRLAASRIISSDTDFDRLAGAERLDPLGVKEWAGSVAWRAQRGWTPSA